VIFSRLKQERERLGLTQPALGDLVGAAKRTVVDWEKGVSSPTAVQLSVLANAGMDVAFVLSGKTLQERAADAAGGMPGRLRALREERGLEPVLKVAGVTAKQWSSYEQSEGAPNLPQGMLQRLIEGFNLDATAFILGQHRTITTAGAEEVVLIENYRVCSASDQEAIRHQAAFLAGRKKSV